MHFNAITLQLFYQYTFLFSHATTFLRQKFITLRVSIIFRTKTVLIIIKTNN